MGKGTAKQARQIEGDVANRSMGLSGTLQGQFMPSLTQAQNYWTSVASGDPTKVGSVVAPQISLGNQAFDAARKQIEMTLPKGGMRDQAMGQLATQQAGNVARLMSGGVAEALSHLENLGQFGVQGAYQGLGIGGNAGNSLAQLAAAQAAAWGSAIGGIAGGAGSFFGGKAGRPGGASGGGGGGMNPVMPMTPPGANMAPGVMFPQSGWTTAGGGGFPGVGYGMSVPPGPWLSPAMSTQGGGSSSGG